MIRDEPPHPTRGTWGLPLVPAAGVVPPAAGGAAGVTAQAAAGGIRAGGAVGLRAVVRAVAPVVRAAGDGGAGGTAARLVTWARLAPVARSVVAVERDDWPVPPPGGAEPVVLGADEVFGMG